MTVDLGEEHKQLVAALEQAEEAASKAVAAREQIRGALGYLERLIARRNAEEKAPAPPEGDTVSPDAAGG